MPEKLETPPEPSSQVPQRAAAAPASDLSEEISLAVEKRPGETVRCVRVFGDSYRCNWWGQEPPAQVGRPLPAGLEVTSSRVRRSTFLRVTKSAVGLHIIGVTSPQPR